MYFATGTSSSLIVENNVFTTALGWTTVAIGADVGAIGEIDAPITTNRFNDLPVTGIALVDKQYETLASGMVLSEADSAELFRRSGEIRKIVVSLPKDCLFDKQTAGRT